MFSWYTVLIWYLQYLRIQKLVILVLELCPINHKSCRSWDLRTHIFGGKFDIISWNRLIIFNEDMKCILLISFLVQNLITSENPISMWIRWIWKSSYWLEVGNLRKLETMFSYKLLPSLSQENRKPIPDHF